jgi:hypothetical protein
MNRAGYISLFLEKGGNPPLLILPLGALVIWAVYPRSIFKIKGALIVNLSFFFLRYWPATAFCCQRTFSTLTGCAKRKSSSANPTRPFPAITFFKSVFHAQTFPAPNKIINRTGYTSVLIRRSKS